MIFFSYLCAIVPIKSLMAIQNINGKTYYSLICGGAARLSANRKIINDLNVFPIPDGDTGDNMYMTISAGRNNKTDSEKIGDIAAKLSEGMLLGARGNSGVILSRIFAGISKGLKGLDTASLEEFKAAMQSGVSEAYGAVSTPVEGTILTVLKDSVGKAEGSDFETYFEELVKEMEASLDRTPDLLPVLKEAGVVDSGGAGLLSIARGMQAALSGEIEEDDSAAVPGTQKAQADLSKFGPDTVLEFGYCTEFLLRLQNAKVDLASFDEQEIKDYLNSAGESVVCFRDDSIVKVHVHTKTPGEILNHCQRWGEFLTIKIENMTLQHSEVTIQNKFDKKDEFKHSKPYGIVAVAAGEGLVNTFKESGVDFVIEGGQTMNPSAQSFLEAFKEVKAETIFVLPNNSNIIMTAQQAAGMYNDSKIIVLPCKNIGTGYVVAASLDTSSKDTDAIVEAANGIINSVSTGMVSKAIRDASQDGISVKEGEFIGIEGSRIISAASNAEDALIETAEKLGTADHDVALLFYGNGIPEGNALAVVESLQKKYPKTEFIPTDGGQPVYDYIIVLC